MWYWIIGSSVVILTYILTFALCKASSNADDRLDKYFED